MNALVPQNIALIGFMGTGKTTIGSLLAKELDWAFADCDVCLEVKAGRPIPLLFAEEGEDLFRERETQMLRVLVQRKPKVISTGGGVVTREENCHLLSQECVVIWLTARVDVVLERVTADRNTRPLLAGTEEVSVRILRLLGERGPKYQKIAQEIVDTSDRTPEGIVREILRKLEKYGIIART